ncbi:MAG TPA: PQQ-binding-like beta-propeller repeat protein [Anaerolineae bacterium]
MTAGRNRSGTTSHSRPRTRRRALAALLALWLMAAACATPGPAPATGRAMTPLVDGSAARPQDNRVAPAGAQAPVPSPDRPTSAIARYDWPQFNGDAQHSGNNTLETTINAGNVGRLRLRFAVALPAPVDGAPAYLSGVTTAAGLRDLLFLTTTAGHILAVDAQDGSVVWVHQNGPGSCTIAGGSSPCYTTASPAADPNRQSVYSYGLDGRVHKYAVGSGSEVTTGGWPAVATLKGNVEKGSSALTVAVTDGGTRYLYVANGGYPGDAGDYQGHITAVNLGDGSQHVFNLACSDRPVHFAIAPAAPNCPAVQTAVWARPGVVYLPATDRIYAATGNGSFDPAGHDWGDTLFALHADGTGAGGDPLLTYTPTDQQALAAADADLGSAAPAILPVPSGSTVAHLALQGGKDARLRLLDLDNPSGQGGAGHLGGELAALPIPQGGAMLTAAAVWRDPHDGSTWVFIANGSGIAGLQLVLDGQGHPTLQPRWQQTGPGGTSPLLANDVLYEAGSGPGLRALDPLTGRQLWQDRTPAAIHWQSPIVANGMVYLTDTAGRLLAYALTPPLPPAAFLPSIAR